MQSGYASIVTIVTGTRDTGADLKSESTRDHDGRIRAGVADGQRQPRLGGGSGDHAAYPSLERPEQVSRDNHRQPYRRLWGLCLDRIDDR